MPFDPHTQLSPDSPQTTAPKSDIDAPAVIHTPPHDPCPDRSEREWKEAYREGLPYWQQKDPVPPPPANPPEIETPGEVLTERQEAFCRAYVERAIGARAARLAGYSPAAAKYQAGRLLKHPLIIRRIHALRDAGGIEYQVRRDTMIDQAEAILEAAMEKGEFYAAIQALTMKARLAGFADYLPGVRILRRDPRDYEQEFWARAHAAEQRIMAARLGEFAGGPANAYDLADEKDTCELRAEGFEAKANELAARASGAAERRGRNRR